jgi:class 3 adenylate cyclase/tetratricopeptide (TPR) repeat protein
VTCAACGTENESGASFCVECGSPLQASCPSCGRPHRGGQKFCAHCGAALGTAAPPAPAPASHGPELRIASVLFVDLVGYTALSERREAEDVRELLSRYFDMARTIVARYGGTVEKFIGDAVMAVWGAPVAREDDAERAVRAGLELVEAVSAFGEEVGAPELRARAGVVTGQVASVANPGEGIVVGDRVNTASRAQSAAAPGTVYVDEVTRQASSAAIAYEDAGEHEVKGKAEPLRLWRAVRAVAGAGGSRRDQFDAPFVGRDAELRMLKDLFHATADRGAARLVAVSGPAGVGKSRLRLEFLHYIDGLADTMLWHSGRCLSYGDGVAYWALAEMVRQRMGIPEEAEPGEAQRKLLLGLERWITDPGERDFLAPRLGTLIGTAQPGLGREELFAGWRLFFERLAEHSPVILAFEDLHWADAGLLEFIEHLVSWSAQRPIFVLTLARPELGDRRPGWAIGRSGVTPLFLEPLTDAAVEELLDGLVAGLPAQLRARIVSQAEGVPLYALETVRGLADRGALVAGAGGRLEVAGDIGQLEIPSTLSSLLTARLDALPAEERSLVKDLAVFGGSFPTATAAALSGLPAEELERLLGSLVRKQVLAVRADPLSPDQGQYAFSQSLLRTVAYEMLSRHERKPRHLAAAAHLRAAFPGEGEEVAEAIAAHLLDAYHAGVGDGDAEELRAQALAALQRAAARALSVGAPETAEHALRSAVELAGGDAERGELANQAAEMAAAAGRWEAALELFELAETAYAAAGLERDAARMAGNAGHQLGRIGRNAEGIDRMRAALEWLGPDRADADVAKLNANLGSALAFNARADEAAEPLERALVLAQQLGLPDVLVMAMGRKALVCAFTGRAEEARALYEGAIALGERTGRSYDSLIARLNLGDLLLKRDLPGARERSEEALAEARRVGNQAVESVAAGNVMSTHAFAGRWDELLRLGDEVMGDGARPDAHYVLPEPIICHALRGETARARELLAPFSERAADDDTVEVRQLHAAVVGTVLLIEGRIDEALDSLLEGASSALETEGVTSMGFRQAWPHAIEAALALGRTEAIEETVATVEALPSGLVPPFVRAQLARGRGRLAAGRGEHDAVEAYLRGAIEELERLGYPYWRARVEVELAEWLLSRDRSGAAAALLDSAIADLERLGAAPALARARDLQGPAPVAAPA